MKNNLRKEKGITLVALIITIILILILTVVTINAVNAGNLFAHANNAVTAYEKVAKDENAMLSNYIATLVKNNKTISQPDDLQGDDESEMSENGPMNLEQIKGSTYMNDNFKVKINDDFSITGYYKDGENWVPNELLDLHDIIYLGYGKISEVENEDFDNFTLDESFSNTDFSLNDDYYIYASYYYVGRYNNTSQFMYAISNATETEKSKMFYPATWMKGKLYNIQTLEYTNEEN